MLGTEFLKVIFGNSVVMIKSIRYDKEYSLRPGPYSFHPYKLHLNMKMKEPRGM